MATRSPPCQELAPGVRDDLVFAARTERIAGEGQRFIGDVKHFAGYGMSDDGEGFEIVIGLWPRIADGDATNVKQALGAGYSVGDVNAYPVLPQAVVYLGGRAPLLRGHPDQVIAAARDALLFDESISVMAVRAFDIGIERGLPIRGMCNEAHQAEKENETTRSCYSSAKMEPCISGNPRHAGRQGPRSGIVPAIRSDRVPGRFRPSDENGVDKRKIASDAHS